MDTVSPEQRSWQMSRVRGKDTKPEILVRRLLWRLGYRYRLHVKDLPGRPDVVIRRLHKVIFVHGCFWHRHPNCRRATDPKTRAEYWADKFASNVIRDQRNIEALKASGWDVLIVWQCELRDMVAVEQRIKQFLEGFEGVR